jgi:hypothetical protein
LQKGKLQSLASYSFPLGNTVGLHLYATDVTGEGGDEMFITLVRGVGIDETNTKLASMIVTFEGEGFRTLADGLPFYLRVAEERNGGKVVLGQAKGRNEPYEGDIHLLQWNGEKQMIDYSSEYKPAHNVYSVYQFNLIPSEKDRIAIIEPDGRINVYYAPTEKVEASSDQNYGEYKEIPYKMELPSDRFVGGFTKRGYGFAYGPVRFEYKGKYEDQFFVIKKRRMGGAAAPLRASLAGPENKEDSIVAVKWTGKSIRETWQSSGLAKDILDFAFLAEGGREQLFVLTRDGLGYAVELLQ